MPILKFALEMILPMCAHCTQKRKIGNIYVKLGIIYDVGIMTIMAIRAVEFSNGVYKIRKIFA